MTTFATAAIEEYDSNIARIEEQIQQLQDILSQQQSERQKTIAAC